MVGNHPIKFWSKVQQRVALSSAESELYAGVYTAIQAIGVKQFAADLGLNLKVDLLLDAKATIAIILREGIGAMKHVTLRWHWLREAVHRKEVSLVKVHTSKNLADPFTKSLPPEKARGLLAEAGFDVLPLHSARA